MTDDERRELEALRERLAPFDLWVGVGYVVRDLTAPTDCPPVVIDQCPAERVELIAALCKRKPRGIVETELHRMVLRFR